MAQVQTKLDDIFNHETLTEAQIEQGEQLVEELIKGAPDLEKVRALIEGGASLEEYDQFGNTPLILATIKGLMGVIKKLVEYKANINAMNLRGATAVHCGTDLCRTDIVSYLVLERKAKVNTRISAFGETPLQAAISNNNYDLVKVFILADVDLEQKDHYGNTAFMNAAYQGKQMIVRLLATYGADVFVKNKKEETAAMMARQQGFHDLADYIEKLENTPTVRVSHGVKL